MPFSRSIDVVVVGAGPAGSACARWLGMAGLSVMLLDKARFPRDKICGDALSPTALPLMERLGVRPLIEPLGAPLHGVRFVAPSGLTAEARYPDLPGMPDHGLAIRRLDLDWALVRAAAETPGVSLVEGMLAREVLWEGDRAVGVRTPAGDIRSRAVVLAEGRFTQLHPRLDRRPRPPDRARRVYVGSYEGVRGLDTLLELWLVGSRRQIVLTPLGPSRAAIAVVWTGGAEGPMGRSPSDQHFTWLKEVPALAERLVNARPLGPLRGLALDPYRGDPAPADGLIAIGDATGFFDPLTGEGMYRALRSAELASGALIEAFATGQLTRRALFSYARRLDGEFAWTYRFVRSVVRLSHSARLAELAIRVMARQPSLARRMAGYQGALLPARGFFLDLARMPWAIAQGLIPRD